MTENCPFCKIIAGDLPADVVYRDEQVIAIRDRQPAAPTHLLVMPVHHVASLHEVDGDDSGWLGHLLVVARRLAEEQNLYPGGYRVVINTGENANQTVFHLHAHVLGGKPLSKLTR